MSEPKFTPGPWSWNGASEINCTPENAKGSGMGPLAMIYAMPIESESIANARLISAAPELYAELKKLEWCGKKLQWRGGAVVYVNSYHNVPVCPACDCEESYGHAANCTLDATLKKASEHGN